MEDYYADLFKAFPDANFETLDLFVRMHSLLLWLTFVTITTTIIVITTYHLMRCLYRCRLVHRAWCRRCCSPPHTKVHIKKAKKNRGLTTQRLD